MRTGDYRLRFRVQGETIIVDKSGHRSEFYEDYGNTQTVGKQRQSMPTPRRQ
jgi:hypothetical protein